MNFSNALIHWYRIGHRDLPWRKTQDPYKIWLSEVILQQTRVDQGMDYYFKFVENFPTVQHLAEASEEEVLKLWQGLGYYSRARNLRATAQLVRSQFNGKFPMNHDELRSLKGIGPYTAAAIASFAFNQPYAVVDGNVYRVLSRYFGIQDAIDSTKGKKIFQSIAQELIPENDPAAYNQAIMELGATICTPSSPDCINCPVEAACVAKKEGTIAELPYKEKRTKVKELHLHYLVLKANEKLLIRHRQQKGFWHKLWDFPCLESNNSLSADQLAAEFRQISSSASLELQNLQHSVSLNHLLSHRKLNVHFYLAETKEPFEVQAPLKWIELTDYQKFAIPRVIDKFWSHLNGKN